MNMTILRKNLGTWLERKLWRHVLFLSAAGILLAGVSVFKGWLHRKVGFDDKGNPLKTDARPLDAASAITVSAKPRSPLTAVATYERIVQDLQRRDDEARPRLRYLTLLHRYNEPTCTDTDLEAYRRAAREMVALLWHGQSSRLGFIDPEQLIFRLDLEDLGWTATTDWHQLVSNYRYGLGGEGDEPLAKLRRQVEELTQDSIPVVRADWFVVALTRPPLAGSNGLLRIPSNELPESIRTLAQRYAAETLDLTNCTHELSLSDPKAVADLIRGQENLQHEFGLAPLLQGERIRREWWESDRNFFSPYQELARLLKIGKPVRVQ